VKVLTLIRHGKSSWKDTSLSDIERPLRKRGKRDAALMGQRLAERGAFADVLISSPATRALATAELIADELGYRQQDIVVDPLIYGTTDAELLDLIAGLNDAWESVILVGHNPDLTDLATRLAPLQTANLPTCGVVELTYDIESWMQVTETEVRQVWFDYPKRSA
jgi:phosphohistidine phosphatase